MIAQEFLSLLCEDKHDIVNDTDQLDRILVNLCEMILQGQRKRPEYYGLVAACVVDPEGRKAAAVNYFGKSGKRVHAERAAVEKYEHEHGELPEGSVIVTTLSPCSEPMPERAGISCSELLNDLNISRAYCGYMDPTQDALRHENFDAVATQNEHIQHVCKEIADCFLKESGVLDPANYRGESITEAGPFNSRQEVINYFVSRGRTAAEGASAWERG